jgi:acyl carrier protein
MTTSTQLLAIINATRANKSRPPLPEILSASRLREDIGFDSLDLAELTVRIEEAFEVDVFADGIVRTVGEIEAKLAAKK